MLPNINVLCSIFSGLLISPFNLQHVKLQLYHFRGEPRVADLCKSDELQPRLQPRHLKVLLVRTLISSFLPPQRTR